MKRVCLLLIIWAVVVFFGCDKQQSPIAPESNDAIQKSQIKPPDYNAAEARAKLDAIAAKARAWVAQHQAQHSTKGAAGQLATAASSKVITVPDDYPTIQQAVNAALAGDKIMVKAGTYNEFVLVTVPVMEIINQGKVTVNGGFVIRADRVTIDHFIINALYYPNVGGAVGVYVFGSSKAKIKNNIISGGDAGIGVQLSTNCAVRANNVSGVTTFAGIVLADADGNTVNGNTATGNINGIGLGFDCDNNIITGNTCDANSSRGIILGGTFNQMSSNSCNGCIDGISVESATSNTIGPNNTANNNSSVGLLMQSDAGNNIVKKNTFLDNAVYDIFNAGTGNTFFKNKAVNTSGV